MSVNVSVILVNYNTKELTKNCIDSIMKNTSGVTYEIILVDNNSSDGSIDMFSNDSRIVFVKNEDNSGFGIGNNIGASQSQGKYLFFLNTDTLLQNNAIKFLYDYCESKTKENLGVVGCWLKDSDGNISTSFVSMPSILGSWKHVWHFVQKKIFLKHNKINASELYVDAVSGADLFMSRDLFFSVGCFDSDYFMYSEESELQYRIKKNGFRNVLIPEPSIIHLEGSSSGKISKKSSFFQLYSMKRGRKKKRVF